MKNKPDILLVMSDQHAAAYMGHDGGMVDTPVMDTLASEGVRFANHYTSCPLCVPARMSFMTGSLPTRIGVTNNSQTISETSPTFLFPLVEAGYETVLIGRMHFVGKDQRHGFMKRLGTDMTPTCWAPQWKAMGEERGDEFIRTFSAGGCLNTIGSGESPVRYYDDMIVEEAVKYFSETHDKPQCVVVGTFGPHFPYVADEALYRKYLQRGYLPPSFNDIPDYVIHNPWLMAHRKEVDEETARRANAAYCALVEESDQKLGKILSAFKAYGARNGREIIYGYTSDHGDTAGARRMYGKQTFFEDSARVPLLLAGEGLPKGKTITANTSIMDIGPTLCELAGTAYTGRFVDGISLIPQIIGESAANLRPVISQYIESHSSRGVPASKEDVCYSVMLRREHWKYIEYHGLENEAILFDLEADPNETYNLINACPQKAAELHELAMLAASPVTAEIEHLDRDKMTRWLQVYERAVGFNDRERWKDNPPSAKGQNVKP